MSGADERVDDPAGIRPPIATRAPAPTPRRLSRKALVTLTGVSALGVAAALGYSLTVGHRSQGTQETVSIDRRNKDALADAPKDYGDVARTASAGIGPPPAETTPITTPPIASLQGSPGAGTLAGLHVVAFACIMMKQATALVTGS